MLQVFLGKISDDSFSAKWWEITLWRAKSKQSWPWQPYCRYDTSTIYFGSSLSWLLSLLSVKCTDLCRVRLTLEALFWREKEFWKWCSQWPTRTTPCNAFVSYWDASINRITASLFRNTLSKRWCTLLWRRTASRLSWAPRRRSWSSCTRAKTTTLRLV